MGRAPCCSKVGLHRGPWSNKEDALLTRYIQTHGEGQWRSLPKRAGLLRCGKSCRLRWMNYLRPDIKRGSITLDEEDLIVRLHSLLGNRWSLIAGRLPGRTDNEIKNYWNTHLSKRLKHQETEPDIHKTKHRPAPEPKKRKTNNKNSSNKKQKKNNKNRVNGETAKTKIHIPKPTRVFTSLSLPISRNNSFENNSVSRSSSRGSDKGDDTEDVVDLLVSDLKVGDDSWGVLVRDEGHDLVNDCDLSFQSQVPTKDHMLEKLYEEYLQLLQTDEEEDQV